MTTLADPIMLPTQWACSTEGLHLAHICLCDASYISETLCQKLHLQFILWIQWQLKTIQHPELLSRAAWLLHLPFVGPPCLELSAGIASAHARVSMLRGAHANL